MKFSIKLVLTSAITFWKFRSPSRLQFPKWEFTWECGGSIPHTIPYSHIPRNMKCDSQASFLARTFASLCLSREPKGRVTTIFRGSIWESIFPPYGIKLWWFLCHWVFNEGLHVHVKFQFIWTQKQFGQILWNINGGVHEISLAKFLITWLLC
jgi:hypothetical protein